MAEPDEEHVHPGIEPRKSGLVLLDFDAMFPDANGVILEIGSGKGRFLIESARAQPELSFIGIEKSLHYYRVIVDRIGRHKLRNAVAIHHDAFLVLREMFPPESVAEVHIYFPDPWPRPRERKRRLIRSEVCDELRRVMKPDAHGVYVTDHEEYFNKALPVLERVFDVELVSESERGAPRTNYEAKYREQGRAIFEARFRRG